MKIGNFNTDGFCALAPMAGVADRTFRELCRGYGAAYTVSELVSAKAVSLGDRKSHELLGISELERPVATQLFGSDPETVATAARAAAKYGPDFLDINMGCPVPKVVNNGEGSALMKNPELAEQIVKLFKNARFAILALVYITFIGSMLIANDMALLTFLPLGYFVLSTTNKREHMSFTFIMQNIAANLGGMLTPFGNPQNLFLYSAFWMMLGFLLLSEGPSTESGAGWMGAANIIAIIMMVLVEPLLLSTWGTTPGKCLL